MSERVTVAASDGSGEFGGYLARAAGTSAPAVVVIQEIFGVNPSLRRVCDRLAEAGFHAFAPDLFWRLKPDIVLDAAKPEEFQQALGYMGQFDAMAGVADIQASIAMLRGLIDSSGKVGAVGYCLGGLLAYFTAAQTDVDAAVGYYGVNIDKQLQLAMSIRRPLMLHVAQEDHFVDKAAQAALKAGLAGNPRVVIHSYAGADHGFARPGGEHYHAASAELADARTLAFFAGALK